MTTSPAAPVGLASGEKLLAEFHPDKGRYWRAHGIMAVALMAIAGIVLWAIDSPYPAIGSLGAILAVAVRGAYLASETLGLVWWLTERRVILPDGQRAVNLLDIARVRTILGDVQIVTRSGDKHLLKHIARPEDVIGQIEQARDRRSKRRT
jgi:hypothetical protein